MKSDDTEWPWWVDPQVFHSLIKHRVYEARRKGRKSLTVKDAKGELVAMALAHTLRRELRWYADHYGGEQFWDLLAHALKIQKTPLDKHQSFIVENRDLFQQMSHAEAVKFLRTHRRFSISVQNYASLIKRLGLTGKTRRKIANSAFPFSEKRGEPSPHEGKEKEKLAPEGSRCRPARRKPSSRSRRRIQ